MSEPKHSRKMAAAATAITGFLVAHGAQHSEICVLENFDCPEPEQVLPDMPEHGHPSGPTGPTQSAYATTGPTGPTGLITGSGNLMAGPSTIAGTDLPFAVAYQQPDDYPNLLMRTLAR